jgi:hypothetical protein
MFKTEIKLTLFLFYFLGIPQKTGTATLTINVADINDEYPRIKGVPYAKIMESQPAGTKVTTIFGQDPQIPFSIIFINLHNLHKISEFYNIHMTVIINTVPILPEHLNSPPILIGVCVT